MKPYSQQVDMAYPCNDKPVEKPSKLDPMVGDDPGEGRVAYMYRAISRKIKYALDTRLTPTGKVEQLPSKQLANEKKRKRVFDQPLVDE